MTDRMRRVDDLVREVLAEAVPELKDPRIGIVTVTGVKTTTRPAPGDRLRQRARLGEEAGARDDGPRRSAHGVLQARLSRELHMKRTPQLAFEYDPSVERGVHMSTDR